MAAVSVGNKVDKGFKITFLHSTKDDLWVKIQKNDNKNLHSGLGKFYRQSAGVLKE
jgi:hypothetical protein